MIENVGFDAFMPRTHGSSARYGFYYPFLSKTPENRSALVRRIVLQLQSADEHKMLSQSLERGVQSEQVAHMPIGQPFQAGK